MSTTTQLETRCPNPKCGHKYQIKPEHVGKTAACKACGQRFVLTLGVGSIPSAQVANAQRDDATLPRPTHESQGIPSRAARGRRVLVMTLSSFGIVVAGLGTWFFLTLRAPTVTSEPTVGGTSVTAASETLARSENPNSGLDGPKAGQGRVVGSASNERQNLEDRKRDANSGNPREEVAGTTRNRFNVHALIANGRNEVILDEARIKTLRLSQELAYAKWSNRPGGREAFFNEYGYHDMTFGGFETITLNGDTKNCYVEYSFGWCDEPPADRYRERRSGIRKLDGQLMDIGDARTIRDQQVAAARELDGKADTETDTETKFMSVTIGGVARDGELVTIVHYTVDRTSSKGCESGQPRIFRWVQRTSDGATWAGEGKSMEIISPDRPVQSEKPTAAPAKPANEAPVDRLILDAKKFKEPERQTARIGGQVGRMHTISEAIEALQQSGRRTSCYSTNLNEAKLEERYGRPDQIKDPEDVFDAATGRPSKCRGLRYGWLTLYITDKGEIIAVDRDAGPNKP